MIDVHLPISLSKLLSAQKDCHAIHVNQILQKWHTSDIEICKYADNNSMVVITKDTDFKNSHSINETPQKVIRVALGNISNNDLKDIIIKYLPFILPLSAKDNFYIEISRDQITIIE